MTKPRKKPQEYKVLRAAVARCRRIYDQVVEAAERVRPARGVDRRHIEEADRRVQALRAAAVDRRQALAAALRSQIAELERRIVARREMEARATAELEVIWQRQSVLAARRQQVEEFLASIADVARAAPR